MRVFKTCLSALIAIMLMYPDASANNIQVTNLAYDAALNKLTFTVAWENSWKFGTEFQDGAWVFIKYAPNGGPQWLHCPISTIGISGGNGVGLVGQPDMVGVMLSGNPAGGTGSVSGNIEVTLGTLTGAFHDFKVFAIEMVKIPQGSFYIGGPGVPLSEKLHRGDDTEEGYHVTNDGSHTYGATSNNFGTTDNDGYMASIPSAYPAGYNLVWCMKYEVSQEQYVEFLNTLTYAQQNLRTKTDLDMLDSTNRYVMSSYDHVDEFYRNGITTDLSVPNNGGPMVFFCDFNENGIPNQIGDGQNIAANWISWIDWLAYLDWAGLRPMTDWEYEKICRGPLPPVSDEYAWGSSSKTTLYSDAITFSGLPNERHSSVGVDGPYPNYPARVGFTATDTSGRVTSGATYYGVMGMSDYVVELVVSAADVDEGLVFTGVLGDGILGTDGNANQTDWPAQGSDVNMRGGGDPVSDLNGGAGNPLTKVPFAGIRGVR